MKKHEYMKKAIKNPTTFKSDNKYAWYNKKKILISKRELTDTNYEREQYRKQFNRFW